ncbi:hypothetical protein LCGC14_2332150 [marine sediment metagenome]|uniref:Uncharacterized protein n=1 Tax=marine sediment metagenome TaxID=412755 RepID=A0A0F9CFB5_9ZZZZ
MSENSLTQAAVYCDEMPVTGNQWEQWRARIWNAIAARVGYPGLAPLEQWMLRSRKEKRCIQCGNPGTVQQESVLIASVDHYFMCGPCDAYHRERAV